AYPCSSDKECEMGRYCHSPHQGASACMACRRKKKRCHRDGMCCPGTRCSNGICIPVTESILTPHIPALDGTRHRDQNHGHYSNHDLGWQNLGRSHTKMSHGMKETPACDHQTALKGFAVLVTSGPKSASQCSIRGKSAPNSAGRALMGWKYSSGVTAQRACLVKYGKMPPIPPKPDSTCVRKYDHLCGKDHKQTGSISTEKFTYGRSLHDLMVQLGKEARSLVEATSAEEWEVFKTDKHHINNEISIHYALTVL
ncbi:hypothetical protein MC885_009205, partial [Smutsia gigantea]